MKKKSGGKKKKSGKSKGKKLKKSAEDQIESLEDGAPSTLVGGKDEIPVDGQADDGKKKKKKKGGKKKKKLTKSEKVLEKLDKAVEKIKKDEAYYERLVSRMHSWLIDNSALAIDMFKHIDQDGEGLVSFDEFKAGLYDLNAPVTKIEMHLICKLLDEEDSGEIDYMELERGLQYAREVKELERQRIRDERQLIPTERKFLPCPCCKMSVVEPWSENVPRYVAIDLRSVTFDMFRDYPGHLDLLVHSHLPVCGLIQMIIVETDISSTKLAVFRDRSRSAESVLSPNSTLEDCGFNGDNRDTPEEIVLFYDYTVEFTECPILMCDHYFGQKVQV